MEPKYPADAYRTFLGRLVASTIGAGEAAHIRRAVRILGIQPGACVCDAACGSGYNIGTLVRAVGPAGLVIAVEDNPTLLAWAERRVKHAGWPNVQLLGTLDWQAFERRPVDGVVVAFNAPMFLGRTDLVETAWNLLKPGGRMVVAGARCTTLIGKLAQPLVKLMLRWAGHPQAWHYWTVHEPWSGLGRLAGGKIEVELILGFWYFLWAEKGG